MDKYGETKGLKPGLPFIYTNGPQDSLHFVVNMSEFGQKGASLCAGSRFCRHGTAQMHLQV